MRLRACDHYTSSTLIGGQGGAGPSSLCTKLEGPMKWVCECKVDVTSTWISSWHQINCFYGPLDCFQNHLLEVDLTQNRETMALRNLTTVILFYFIMCEDSAWIKIHWNSIWLRARSHMTSHYTWWPMTTLHGFGGILGRPLDTFFWALTMSWHVCEVDIQGFVAHSVIG